MKRASDDEESRECARGYSYPLAAVWTLYAALLLIPPAFDRAWVTGVTIAFYIALCAVFLYTAFDRKAYERIGEAYPGVTWREWRLHYLLLLSLLPGTVLGMLLYLRDA